MPRSLKRVASNVPKQADRPAPGLETVAVGRDHLGQLGVEIWRLGERLRKVDDSRLADSFERLMRVFAALNGRAEDMTGQAYIEGSNVEVLHAPVAVDAASTYRVEQTIRPAVWVDGQLVVIPQLILEFAGTEGDEDGDATTVHD